MNSSIYDDIQFLRLAATVPYAERLNDPMGSSERRSPICGSRVAVDVDLDELGRVSSIGMLVRACKLGQASASLMAKGAIGKSAAELGDTRDGLASWLAGTRDAPPDWPGLEVFTPALPHSARHPSIRLAFEAAAEAAEQAAAKAPAR